MKLRKEKIKEKVEELQQRQGDSLHEIEEEYKQLKAERERLKQEEEEARKKG